MSEHLFYRIDPESTSYPRPIASILPYLTYRQLRLRTPHLPYFLRTPHQFLRNSRTAIAQILNSINLAVPVVLVPAYICKSVLEPIIWSGCRPLFYKLHRDLQIDCVDFREKAQQAGAAIVTHFFGMPQPMDEITSVCANSNLVMIEDCAHALLGEHKGTPLGSFGDYAIASTVKFCPGVDGGILISKSEKSDWQHCQPSRKRSRLHSFVSLLDNSLYEHAARFRLRSSVQLHNIPDEPEWRQERVLQTELAPGHDGRYEYFDPDDLNIPGDPFSYWLLYHLDYDFMAKKRRENFLIYCRMLAQSSVCAPLYSSVPNGMIPYMFPLYVPDSMSAFRKLKYTGIPIWRWEQQYIASPEPSVDFGFRLLHLPCHQCLDTVDIERICAHMLRVLGEN